MPAVGRQRHRLLLLGLWALVAGSLISAAIVGGLAYGRISTSASIAEPVRITTSQFRTERESPRVQRAVVTFRAGAASVTTRLDGSRTDYGYLPLAIVYDASEPRTALLASDYDAGRDTATRVTAWVCGGVVAADLLALGYGIVLLARRPSRRVGN